MTTRRRYTPGYVLFLVACFLFTAAVSAAPLLREAELGLLPPLMLVFAAGLGLGRVAEFQLGKRGRGLRDRPAVGGRHDPVQPAGGDRGTERAR